MLMMQIDNMGGFLSNYSNLIREHSVHVPQIMNGLNAKIFRFLFLGNHVFNIVMVDVNRKLFSKYENDKSFNNREAFHSNIYQWILNELYILISYTNLFCDLH